MVHALQLRMPTGDEYGLSRASRGLRQQMSTYKDGSAFCAPSPCWSRGKTAGFLLGGFARSGIDLAALGVPSSSSHDTGLCRVSHGLLAAAIVILSF